MYKNVIRKSGPVCLAASRCVSLRPGPQCGPLCGRSKAKVRSVPVLPPDCPRRLHAVATHCLPEK